jgi:hypothetical protein
VITPAKGSSIKKTFGGFSSSKSALSESLVLSTLQYDQKKDILIQVHSDSEKLAISLSLQYKLFNKYKTVEITVSDFTPIEQVPDFELQQCRFSLIESLSEVISTGRRGQKKLEQLIAELQKASDPRVLPLLADAQGIFKFSFFMYLLSIFPGQISEAISKDEWWNRWGRHYLPSLLGAHLLQQCNNFKVCY